MHLFAYRRTPKIPTDWAAEDSLNVCIARFDTDTRVLQMLTKEGIARHPPIQWNNGNTAQHFYDWVRQYPQWWSLTPEDAFWHVYHDADLLMDEGL